jgi:hypothetical protein
MRKSVCYWFGNYPASTEFEFFSSKCKIAFNRSATVLFSDDGIDWTSVERVHALSVVSNVSNCSWLNFGVTTFELPQCWSSGRPAGGAQWRVAGLSRALPAVRTLGFSPVDLSGAGSTAGLVPRKPSTGHTGRSHADQQRLCRATKAGMTWPLRDSNVRIRSGRRR